MFTKFINIPVFIISFIVGIVFVRLSAPDTTTVFVYPTPDNIQSIEYKDKASNCFEYTSQPVPCPKNPDEITTVPPQMGSTKPAILATHKIKIGNTNINKI